MLVAHHGAVPRLHGDAASLFRFPCQTAIPPGIAGSQRTGHPALGGGDFRVRAYLLLGHLPAGRDAGYRFLLLRQTEKIQVPFFLFARKETAKIRCARSLHRRCLCRTDCHIHHARPVFLVWTDCHQLVRSGLAGSEQRAGLPVGTGGQLCFLSCGYMDKRDNHFRRFRSYLRRNQFPCMEARAHLLQHDLSGGYAAGLHQPPFAVSYHGGHGQM